MVIQDLSFFTEIPNGKLTEISGGKVISVPITNSIKDGRARLKIDLREGLTDEDELSDEFQDCYATFDDFYGELNITCQLGDDDVFNALAVQVN